MDFITRRVSAKTIGLSKQIIKGLKKYGVEDDVQVIRKGIVPEDTKFKDGERSSVDYITTKGVDRDGEVVVPNGAVLDFYQKNPVVLFAHDYRSMPVGKSLWIKKDEKGLISKTQYAKTEKATELYEYRKQGFPMAKSIGFIPLESVDKDDFDKLDLKALDLKEEDLDGANRVYPKWIMLEYSDVPVPSNPEALELAISKGIITAEEAKKASDENAFVLEIIDKDQTDEIEGEGLEEKDLVTEEISSGDTGEEVEEEVEGLKETEFSEPVLKPETTDNYHHIPVMSASSFVEGSFRTITLSASQGIKAVIGKLKSDPDGPTKTQKYLFDVEKWSMSEAQTWVDNHKDMDIDEVKESIPEDNPVENSLLLGLNKIVDRLDSIISAVKENEQSTEKVVEVEEKVGRVLSKKTRAALDSAIDSLIKATEALNELIKTVDSDDVEQEVEQDEKALIEIESEPEVFGDFDSEKVKEVIRGTVSEILSNQKHSVANLVAERLNKAKGKVF